MTSHRKALKAIQKAIEPIRSAVGHALAEDAARAEDGDPIPDTEHSMEWEIPVIFYWNSSKGERRTFDSPGEPPHLEDVTVMLGEHDITEMLSPEALADVREAMLRDMEAGT